MSGARRRIVGVLAICALLVQSARLGGQEAPTFRVLRVVDGDTVVLEGVGTVRLIGIDTPETVDPREPVQAFGLEASAHLKSLVGGQLVRIEYDQQRIDKYGRTLGYLYLRDGTSVNKEMVRQGFAHAYLTYPFRYVEEFRAAEREARGAKKGLWGDPPEPAKLLSMPNADRVWVNTASRVYHCLGTRYYGNTVRGQYMSEAEARFQGNRPAGGTTCVPAGDDTQTDLSAIASVHPTAPNEGAGMVWVNSSSGVYHCPGTQYYGKTKRGEFMSEADARGSGYRPAGGRGCEQR